MPRAIRAPSFETRTARLKLPVSKKPYGFTSLAKGIGLGYRRNAGPGVWVVRAADGKGGAWTKAFANADDHENADGEKVLTFWQAQDRARKLARGTDADTGRPVTVDEALTDYEGDLKARGGNPANATRLRVHLPPGVLSKPVSLLVARELTKWRDGLRASGVRGSTTNRSSRALKAALNLAAKLDGRITNATAWKVGLASVSESDSSDGNLVLSEEQIAAVIVAAYDISQMLGLLVEVHVATGARSGQLALLNVGDLQMNGGAPKLLVPSSLKGKGRTTRVRKRMPISPALAAKLKQAGAGRDSGEPLLLNPDGERWYDGQHFRPFAAAAAAARLPDGATIYALRHTAITKALLANVPVRLVASSFDTSVAMIEKTYSKFIADHGDEVMRRAMVTGNAAKSGNVFSIAGR